jgi:monovalent cation:H+ antiporter, CPA1 family
MFVELAIKNILSLAIILAIGLLITTIANRLKIANVLLLIITGLTMSYLYTTGILGFTFTQMFIVTIAFFTLIIVVFEGTSKFSLKVVDSLSLPSLHLFFMFLILGLIILTPIVSIVFFNSLELTQLLLSSIFIITLTSTDPTCLFSILKSSSNKVIKLLEIESIINTPFAVILPLIVFEIMNDKSSSISQIVIGQISPLILQITAGIGIGVIFGFIVPRFLKRVKNKILEPAVLLTAILLGFILAEHVGGSGVLAVATTGIFYGNIYLKQKEELQSFISVISNIFMILVFILVGFAVNYKVELLFILQTLGIFLLAILVRFLAITIVLSKEKYMLKERWFMALIFPKGVAVAVVAITLAIMAIGELTQQVETLIQLIVSMMLFSLLTATIVSHFENYF